MWRKKTLTDVQLNSQPLQNLQPEWNTARDNDVRKRETLQRLQEEPCLTFKPISIRGGVDLLMNNESGVWWISLSLPLSLPAFLPLFPPSLPAFLPLFPPSLPPSMPSFLPPSPPPSLSSLPFLPPSFPLPPSLPPSGLTWFLFVYLFILLTIRLRCICSIFHFICMQTNPIIKGKVEWEEITWVRADEVNVFKIPSHILFIAWKTMSLLQNQTNVSATNDVNILALSELSWKCVVKFVWQFSESGLSPWNWSHKSTRVKKKRVIEGRRKAKSTGNERDFEPTPFGTPARCKTNWAIRPTGSTLWVRKIVIATAVWNKMAAIDELRDLFALKVMFSLQKRDESGSYQNPITLVLRLFTCTHNIAILYAKITILAAIEKVVTGCQKRPYSTLSVVRNVLAFSTFPLMKKDTIPPKPFICFLANSCCGWDCRPKNRKSSGWASWHKIIPLPRKARLFFTQAEPVPSDASHIIYQSEMSYQILQSISESRAMSGCKSRVS